MRHFWQYFDLQTRVYCISATMESNTVLPTSSDPSSSLASGIWFDIFLPIVLIGFALLIVVLCYGSLVKLCHKCRRHLPRRRNRSRVESLHGTDNHDYDDTDGTPSIYNQDRISSDFTNEFRVVSENSTSELPRATRSNSIISEKLPTYEEFMLEKNKEKQTKERNQRKDISKNVNAVSPSQLRGCARLTESLNGPESRNETSAVDNADPVEQPSLPPPPYSKSQP